MNSSQVRTAQKGVPTGQVYQQNEQRLGDVGPDCLKVQILLDCFVKISGKTLLFFSYAANVIYEGLD